MKSFIIAIIGLIIASCQSPLLFEQYQELPKECWNKYQELEYPIEIPDSGLYHIALHIRHTTDYKFSSIWCILSTRSLMKTALRDTICIHVADTNGRWLGNGNTLKNLTQPISRNPIALPSGTIRFRIKHGMGIKELEGVKSVGISIKKVIE